jgi:hypothetical protein
LIRQVTRVFGLSLSSPRQPGQAFFSLVCAIQRRQFIPQGAISTVRITFVFADLLISVIFVSCKALLGDDLIITGGIAYVIEGVVGRAYFFRLRSKDKAFDKNLHASDELFLREYMQAIL